MKQRQDWKQMREGIIGLGEDSSKRNYYPELMARMVDLEQAQENLRRSELNLRTLFNSLPDGVIIHDLEGRILEVNEAMLAMYGVTQASFRNYSLMDYSAHDGPGSDVLGEIRQHVEDLAPGGTTVFQWRARRPLSPGEDFDVEVSLRKVAWYEQEAVVAVVRDISERKRLETMLSQSQKLESLGQLAGGVAHDTNNMLGVILGFAEILLEDAPEESLLRRDLEQIRKAALSSADLIRKLLAFSRKQPIHPMVVDLNILVRSTQQMLRRLIGEQYSLAWQPAPAPCFTRIDPLQVEQILTNLCLNARDAVRPGDSITIETAQVVVDEVYAKFHPDAYPGKFAAVIVSDTGTGMSPEVQARIFEPFFTTKPVGCGTGLGLATVYGIVRQNKGFISVYSMPGMGTTFRIHLPCLLEESTPDLPPPEAAPLAGHETVLLVEDEEALLALGSRLLEGAGYQVIATAHAEEALRIAAAGSRRIDLLATDLVMPVLNGRQLYERIREFRPDLKVLFLSGYPAGTIGFEDPAGDRSAFLQKPFTRRGFLEKVRDVLNA